LSITLPQPIAAYFAADDIEPSGIAECFTEDAVVRDERATHVGRDAICRWRAEAATKYAYVSQPIAVARDGDRTIVTSRVTGDFPGSPVDLRYGFILEGDKIAHLEIVG
jgi:hypothetical protein